MKFIVTTRDFNGLLAQQTVDAPTADLARIKLEQEGFEVVSVRAKSSDDL